MYQNDPRKCLTNEVRLSYCNLNNPRQQVDARGNKTGDPKYSVTMLIPKTDTATLADLDAAFNAAIEDAVSTKWGGVRPPQIDRLIHDGDGVRPNGTPFGDECHGHYVITASSIRKPQVVGVDNYNVDLDPRDIYSGMYGRVTVRFYGYNAGGKRGIACGLGNVLKTRDGEVLGGGGASAASDFAGIANAPAPMQTPAQMTGYTAAAQPAYPVQPAYPAQAPVQPAYPVQPVTPGYPAQVPYPAQGMMGMAGGATQGMQVDPVTGAVMPA